MQEKECGSEGLFCNLSEILLFGNKKRLKVGESDKYIYLDYRVERLQKCFSPFTGWRHRFGTMTDFLEDSVSQYKRESTKDDDSSSSSPPSSFVEFVRMRFKTVSCSLKECISIFCTHIPKAILKQNFQRLACLMSLIGSLESLLLSDMFVSEDVEKLFSSREMVENFSENERLIWKARNDCVGFEISAGFIECT